MGAPKKMWDNFGILQTSKLNETDIPYILASEAEKDKAELVKALKQYGSHIGTCPRRAWSAEQAGCTCGFDKAHNHAQSPNARRADSGAGESGEGA